MGELMRLSLGGKTLFFAGARLDIGPVWPSFPRREFEDRRSGEVRG